jgi:hypothetical protein
MLGVDRCHQIVADEPDHSPVKAADTPRNTTAMRARASG